MDKEIIVGVDFNDDLFEARSNGKSTGEDLVKQILDNIKAAGATSVCWRVTGVGMAYYPSKCYRSSCGKSLAENVKLFRETFKQYDPLAAAIDYAHELGLKIYAYITLFDDAYQDLQTQFGREHPEYYIRQYSQEEWNNSIVAGAHRAPPETEYIKGVFSYGYPEVREWRMELVRELINYKPDALYFDCARTHAGIHPIPVYGWYPTSTFPHLRYGYDPYEVQRYREEYGKNPPFRAPTCVDPLVPNEDEINWNRVRGSFLTEFISQAGNEIRAAGQNLCVCFYPATYNGFNPGYHCRQQLGWFDVAWKQWVSQGLIDEIRLNTDHRKFAYDDWQQHSQHTYRFAQQHGIRVFIDWDMDQVYDRLENPPASLPISFEKDGELIFQLQEQMLLKMLQTTADGVFGYEHCNTEPRTFEAMRRAIVQYDNAGV